MANEINPILKKQIITTFVEFLSNIKDSKKLDRFLSDFLTDKELLTLSRRFAILYWLKKKRSIENIRNNLKATNDDISYAKLKGKGKVVKNAVNELEAQEWASKWERKIINFVNKGP